MLPLVGTEMAMRSDRLLLPILGIEISMGQWASALVAVCIVVPQLVVALIAPAVGRLAGVWGRRPVLLVGFAALPARATILAFNSDPLVIVAAQMFDGLCAAVLGVLVPLSLADISRGQRPLQFGARHRRQRHAALAQPSVPPWPDISPPASAVARPFWGLPARPPPPL